MKKRLPLQSFRLQNFKAVRDSGTVKFNPLTVIVGNNGSGKSSIIEGLETFTKVITDGLDHAMQRWRGFENIWNLAAEHKKSRLEGERSSFSNPIVFELEMNLDDVLQEVRQVIALGNDERIFIQAEDIVQSGQGRTQRTARDCDGKVSLFAPKPASTASKGGNGRPSHSSVRLKDGQSMLTAMLVLQLFEWQFLALSPEVMGQPVPQQRAERRVRLAKNGANIAEYLNEIRTLDLDVFNDVVASLKRVLHYAEDLIPVLTIEPERSFFLKLKEESFEVPGWVLSTGTLRILALLACLRHPNPPKVLFVEEIENGLDPRTLHFLVEELRAAIDRGKTQIIATTHSPFLLDLLDLSHIIIVERVDGEPTFQRPNQEELAAWSKSFAPGRLYTMGRLTRGD